MRAQTIDEVLTQLDDVIKWAGEKNSPIGIFASLYYAMTAKVKEGIDQGFFQDNERMEKLDVLFANEYIIALEAFKEKKVIRKSWNAALWTCSRWDHTLLQYLLICMNSHINLDLGIATAKVAPGDKLQDVREDFLRINSVIQVLSDPIANDIGKLSPWVGLALRWSKGSEDAIMDFSIKLAREYAWHLATKLAPLPEAEWTGTINKADEKALKIANAIRSNGFPLGLIYWFVRLFEEHDVKKIAAEMLDRKVELDKVNAVYKTLK